MGSEMCIRDRYRALYGLLRVNPADACFMVQARMPRQDRVRGMQWGQVDVTTLATTLATGRRSRVRLSTVHPELSPRFLQGVASVYRRCFGLASNLSCPRTVGDRKLWSGAEAPCLRSLTARCADADGLAAAAGAGSEGGFECAGAGMRELVGSIAIV